VTADNRVTALRFAIDAMAVDGNLKAAQAGDVTAMANVFYRWLEGPAVMVLTHDSMTYDQAAPDGPGTPTTMKGTTVQLTDIQQVTLSVAEQDSKGQPVTADQLAWSVDNPGVVALTPSADGYSCLCVAGTDGTATVTVADNSVTPPLTATDVITVVSSAATGLVISEGTAEDQPPAAPPAA
jgi:hypothetical protein